MAQVHRSNGRQRPRDLNAAMASAVEAEQRRARTTQTQEIDRAADQRVSPAAALIIDKLAAIERRVGIQPMNGNFQGAELRIHGDSRIHVPSGAFDRRQDQTTVDEKTRDDRWDTQAQVTHVVISAVVARLDALEQRLQVVLMDVPPTKDANPGTAPLAHTPVTKLQATQAEIIARLQAALGRLDVLLARIDL